MSRGINALRFPRACAALLALVGFLGATEADAQLLAGRILDSASTQPIPGAVVQALAEDGNVLARALSDARGAFALRLPDGASAQIRVQRIGFRPRVLPLAPATSDLVVIHLVRIPAFLDPRRVVAAQCRRRGRSSPVGLIEQARAGLLASVVARDVNPAAMTRITYERRFARDGQRVESQFVRIDSAASARNSFTAVSDAAGFVRRGFLLNADDGAFYFAPDAETLLDDAFAAGYCFHVMPSDRDRPNQVGLGFEASNSRRGRVDVSGALWIDTVARELRDIVFAYEGLPRMLQVQRPGGRIEFATLANGITVVSRWQLNPTGVELDTLRGPRDATIGVAATTFRFETGGELARATWRDGTSWRAPLGTFVGRAAWHNGLPARGLQYSLRNSPYAGVSDSTGRLVIGELVPGSYELLAEDSALRAVGLSIPTKIEFSSARDVVEMPIPALTVDDYVTARCRDQGRPNREGDHTFLIVRAFWDDGSPVAGARWSVSLIGPEGPTEVEAGGESGSDGVMTLCQNLIRDSDTEILVSTEEASAPVVRRRLSARTTVVRVVLARP